MLVLVWVLALVGVAGGMVLLIAPKRVRAFIQGIRATVFGERWAARQPMINTPIAGGIGMIVIGIVVIMVLVTEGTRAVQ